jgi:hypothetical protein
MSLHRKIRNAVVKLLEEAGASLGDREPFTRSLGGAVGRLQLSYCQSPEGIETAVVCEEEGGRAGRVVFQAGWCGEASLVEELIPGDWVDEVLALARPLV